MKLDDTLLPLGKYKGKSFDEAPLLYLDWLRGQVWVEEPLKTKLNSYLSIPVVAKELDNEIAEKEWEDKHR